MPKKREVFESGQVKVIVWDSEEKGKVVYKNQVINFEYKDGQDLCVALRKAGF